MPQRTRLVLLKVSAGILLASITSGALNASFNAGNLVAETHGSPAAADHI